MITTLQNTFTADGSNRTLSIPSGVDWIRVINQTAFNTSGGGTDLPFEFYFQRGMTAGTAQQWTKLDTVANDPVTVSLRATGGFTLVDQSSDSIVSAAQAFTGISNATQPVVSTAATNVRVGDIVILSQTTTQRGAADATSLSGIPFVVTAINSGVSITISNALQQAPGAGIAAAAGSFRIIRIPDFFVPHLRFIANMTAVANSVVTTTVNHGYSVGEEVTFLIGSTNQMVEANGLTATVTATTASTITTDLDASAFTAFRFPTAAQAAGTQYTPAMVIPAGMDTAQAISSSVNILGDAVMNNLVRGVFLGGAAAAGAAAGPAGANGDVMFWQAGTTYE